MTPLERHIQLMSGFAGRQAGQEDLAPLMETNAAPGQRAFVYRNSGTLACVDALRSNYSRLALLMGADAFGDMARAYAARHPATRRSLVGYGGDLPDFIAEHQSEHGMAWLSDLARLDRGWLEAHLASDASPLSAEAVQHLGEAELMNSRFQLHPTLRRVSLNFDITQLWSNLEQDEPPQGQVAIAQRAAAMVFWRPEYDVLFQPADAALSAFLQAIAAGAPLSDACEQTIQHDPQADLSSMIAFSFQSGLFSGLNSTGEINQ